MLDWLSQNWGSILAVAVVAGIFVAIVVARIRARRQGKSSCGCGCSQCAMSGLCHAAPTEKEEKE